MFGIDFAPGFIMGIREGLEAFLIIAIMLEYLNKTNRKDNKVHVWIGLGLGILASLIIGFLLLGLSNILNANSDNIGKLWEFVASFAALILITSFIVFMIKNKTSITQDIRNKIDVRVSKVGIILLAAVMVAREGAEVSLFAFSASDQATYISGAITGIVVSAILAFLIYKSLIKVNLKTIFSVTLFYLILQAGFMLGYSIHELLSYLKAEDILSSSNIIYMKLFDASSTFLNHKEQPVGIAMYVLFGWYSKPEIIQFVTQYTYTGLLLWYFFKQKK